MCRSCMQIKMFLVFESPKDVACIALIYIGESGTSFKIRLRSIALKHAGSRFIIEL